MIPLSRVANIRSVHTLASVHPIGLAAWVGLLLLYLAIGIVSRLSIARSFPSRIHLPTPLGSTVVTRFIATMGTLTPALLLHAPRQVSLITRHALPGIQSPPTPCAPFLAMLLAPGRLGPRFAFWAIGGSSDFVHRSQSRQSHMAVSSLCDGHSRPISLQAACSLPVALHPTSR